jgi:hypothetical protein
MEPMILRSSDRTAPRIPDLLPDGYAVADVIAPIAILRHQGICLSRKTGRIVEGFVRLLSEWPDVLDESAELIDEWEGGIIYLSFDAVIPSMGGFSEPLFVVAYQSHQFYPCILNNVICDNQGAFYGALTQVFAADFTRYKIGQLLASA